MRMPAQAAASAALASPAPGPMAAAGLDPPAGPPGMV